MNEWGRLLPYQRSAKDKAIRGTFGWLALKAKIPHLERIRIEATPLHRDGRSPQDVAACAPHEKAARDGLVDAGVITDDGPRYVVSCLFQSPDVCGVDGLELTVIEVP